MANNNAGSDPGNYSLLIKGGTVYTGGSGQPVRQDIAIEGDSITAIGNLGTSADKVINATGYIVTPGFIDIHNHADIVFPMVRSMLKAEDVPELKGNLNFIFQGVTTIVTGNCGLGYTSIDEWFDYLGSLSFGTNVYHLAPHGKIRLELFGPQQPLKLTPDQLSLLRKKIVEEIEKGALGVSTGLEYAPGQLADTDELCDIAGAVARLGGLYATHMRDESGRGILGAVKEAIAIGRRTNIPVQISHLKLGIPYDKAVNAGNILSIIEDARNSGMDITADQYPYNTGSTFMTWMLEDKDFLLDDRVKPEFRTPEGKVKIAREVSKRLKYLPPEDVLICLCAANKEFEGKTLGQVAELLKKDPAELYADLVCVDAVPIVVMNSQDGDALREFITHEYVFTGSDGHTLMKGIGKYHPRSYATFTRKLRQFVLDEKKLDLNFVIRSMTSLPAEKFKIKGRGRIAEGCFADIAVIDLQNIRDNATYLNPDNFSEGIVHLLVNGMLTIEDGKYTGQTGGRPLRGK
jgi:N-acyl-D-amino-acid deacylase